MGLLYKIILGTRDLNTRPKNPAYTESKFTGTPGLEHPAKKSSSPHKMGFMKCASKTKSIDIVMSKVQNQVLMMEWASRSGKKIGKEAAEKKVVNAIRRKQSGMSVHWID